MISLMRLVLWVVLMSLLLWKCFEASAFIGWCVLIVYLLGILAALDE